jgi:predicted helicase
LDYFRGSYGAKALFPLFHDAEAKDPNISSALLDFLATRFETPHKSRAKLATDLAAYVYAILAQPAYSETFCDELLKKELRVPLTKDKKLFDRAASFGRCLINMHTYGERFTSVKKWRAKKGKAKCLVAVPDTEKDYPESYCWENSKLRVGAGVFAPVDEKIYDFEVSGLKVLQSWLGYRMKEPKGKKSSPLDSITPKYWSHDFTKELLELLWLLEATIDGYAKQKALLNEVLESPLFAERELPPVPNKERKWRGDLDNGDAVEIDMPEVKE